MARLRMKYVNSYVDRHGKIRRYFRRPGHTSIPLIGEPGSGVFADSYRAAWDFTDPKAQTVKHEAFSADSLEALVREYLASAQFANLRPITQSTYRNELNRLCRAHGDKPVALLDRRGVLKLIAERSGRPGAANQLLKMLRMIMGFAISIGVRADDPTARIKKLKVEGDGFIAWSEDDIARFEARHPIGTKARLALALLLYTAQRRGDVVRLGPKDVSRGMFSIRQSKTSTSLTFPVHPDLAPILAALPADTPTFLVTEFGRPFEPAGFGNWFRARCEEAGLPKGYNAHGLRKASLRRLAEAGCTTKEIMSISGHKDINEVERYVAAAENARLARNAMTKVASDAYKLAV